MLSAGLKRRVLLGRGLVRNPDLLLLDEPTNHLDIDTITWLEDFLVRWAGTLLFVTHDRAFLQRLTTRIVELDRGRLFDWNSNYATFLKRKEAMLSAEQEENVNFDKKLAQEDSGSAGASKRAARATKGGCAPSSACARFASSGANSPAKCACRSRPTGARAGW